MMRRVETWLRATMKQKRFNSLAILTSHKDITYNLDLVEVPNIVSELDKRYNHFRRFSTGDL